MVNPWAFHCGHIISRHQGGSHILSNLQAEHAACSIRDGAQESKRAQDTPRLSVATTRYFEPLVTLIDFLVVMVLDVATRTATVVPTETGFPAVLWRNGVEKLGRGGYGGPTVWAHGFGRQKIAPGQPEGGAIKFEFHKGDGAWPELVGTPRLAATVVLARATNRIMDVSFAGRGART